MTTRSLSPATRFTPRGASRRHFLKASTAVGASLLVSRYGLAQSRNPFTLGVASGDPAPDGAVLWTRLAPEPLAPDGMGGVTAPVSVTWEIAADDSMRQIVQRGTHMTDPALAHAVHVEASGLAPGRPYWYRFTAMGAQSPVGRTRTAPAPHDAVQRLRFAFASCSHWELGYFSAYRHMAAENPDLVLFLGDYIYEYSAPEAQTVRRHDGPTAVDLVGYRNRHALYRTDPDLQALHAAAPCLVTWDDHELENDYADIWPQDMRTDPATFMRMRVASYQAYYEHMPLRKASMPRNGAMRLHNRVRFGTLATFNVLDGRQYRSKQPCEAPPSRRGRLVTDACTDRVDPNRSLIGLDQERWLFDGFKTADGAWTLLAQAQLMAQFRQKTAAGEASHWTEAWDGYPASRQRILDAMAATRLANPVVIGGDIHSFWATELKADFNNPASATVATEFVGTSVTSNGPPHDYFEKMRPDNPHVTFFDARPRGYVAVDLTAGRMETRFQAISDRRDRDATVSTLKRFVVESGRPGAIAD